jgi:NAD(P)H-dependent FMN reductase
MSYFKVITNPSQVFVTADTIEDGKIVSEEVKSRLNELVDSTITLSRSE